MKNIYKTDDTNLAAYIYTKNHPLQKAEIGEYEHIFFYFNINDELLLDVEAYKKDSTIAVLSYGKALRYLKRIIINIKQRENKTITFETEEEA